MTKRALIKRLCTMAFAAALAITPFAGIAAESTETEVTLATATSGEETIIFTTESNNDEDTEDSLQYAEATSFIIDQSPAESSACTLYVNGKKQTAKPFYKDRTLMVPLRTITDRASWNYEYSDGKVEFGKSGKNYKLSIGKNSYPMGGSNKKLDFAPEIVDNRTYVPWQFVELGLGMKVTINNDGKIEVSAKPSKSSMSLTVNGKSAPAPYYSGKVLMIPLRGTVQSLGYKYLNDSKNRRAVFTAKNINTAIYWDKNSYPVNNKLVKLEIKPEIKNDILYVPASYAEKALRCKVSVNNSGKVTIKK